MRVNVYDEEMTDRVEIISKEIDGHKFTGLRFYLELPVTVGGKEGNHRSLDEPVFPPINGNPAQVAGPFIHRPGDDDSAAVTFWGKQDLRKMLRKALDMLDAHYGLYGAVELKLCCAEFYIDDSNRKNRGWSQCQLPKGHSGDHTTR